MSVKNKKGWKLTRQGKLEAPLVADVSLSANYNCEIIGLKPIETYPALVSALLKQKIQKGYSLL